MPKPAPNLNQWLTRVSEQPEFAKRLARAADGDGTTVFDHISEAATGWLIALIVRSLGKGQRIWALTPSPKFRERLALELELWKTPAEILADPPPDGNDGEVTDTEAAANRIEVLNVAADAQSFLILADTAAFNEAAPAPTTLGAGRVNFDIGDACDPQQLSTQLAEHGYERSHLVQSRGQFAVRGGILDVFPWQAANPLRLEFFDTDIDSIREFDVDSQASLRKLKQAELLLGEPENDASVAAYRRPEDIVITLADSKDPDPLGNLET